VLVDVTEARGRALLGHAVDRFRGGGDPQAYLDAGGAIAFVAVDPEAAPGSSPAALGWCWGYCLRRPDGLTMAYLHELEVAEGARRKGHGRALVRAFLDAAAARGATKAFLLTELDNVAACSLYESLGARRPALGPVTSYWFALP
jgi:ribosomal protein S18 acetylase RimI-like enzyme